MPGGRPISRDPVYGVWFSAVWPPSFGGIWVGMVFALHADGPAWETWAGRAVVTLFWWLVAFVSAAQAFRELRRRAEWVPPGATRRPWPAAAAYAAAMLLAASTVVAGFLACLEFVAAGGN